MDVAILGGGPAGAAAALTLRRYCRHLHTILIDPEDPDLRVGETLPPSVLPLFDYLGLRPSFLAQGWIPATGTESAWGARTALRRESVFSRQGPGWHIDRQRFDRWLRDAAVAAGAEWRRTRLVAADRTDTGWNLQLESGDLGCRIAVDATGRAARFARLAGARRHACDALIGTLWWFQGIPRAHAEGSLVEATPEGWWYSAHLPGARVVAGFLTDADLLPPWVKARDLATGLNKAPLTAARLDGARLEAGPVTRNASTSCSEPTAGPGWVAAGDAALAFDPLASLGIGHAMLSGIEAARAVSVAAAGRTEVFPAFADAARQLFAEFRHRQQAMYLAERRWLDAPFWARRHAGSMASRRAGTPVPPDADPSLGSGPASDLPLTRHHPSPIPTPS